VRQLFLCWQQRVGLSGKATTTVSPCSGARAASFIGQPFRPRCRRQFFQRAARGCVAFRFVALLAHCAEERLRLARQRVDAFAHVRASVRVREFLAQLR